MNIYEAIFQHKEEDIEHAIRDYIKMFGEVSFNKNIKPYIERETWGIFLSPRNKEIRWFMDRLGRVMAYRLNEVMYQPPNRSNRIFKKDEFVFCTKCGLKIAKDLADEYDGNLLCYICYREVWQDWWTRNKDARDIDISAMNIEDYEDLDYL